VVEPGGIGGLIENIDAVDPRRFVREHVPEKPDSRPAFVRSNLEKPDAWTTRDMSKVPCPVFDMEVKPIRRLDPLVCPLLTSSQPSHAHRQHCQTRSSRGAGVEMWMDRHPRQSVTTRGTATVTIVGSSSGEQAISRRMRPTESPTRTLRPVTSPHRPKVRRVDANDLLIREPQTCLGSFP
jgi:hypothetical protein